MTTTSSRMLTSNPTRSMRLVATIQILVLTHFLFYADAQQNRKSKLECVQGIWENTMNSDAEKAFTIIKGHASLSFVYDTSNNIDFPLNESIEGFQNFANRNYDSIHVDSLKNDGLYYTIANINDIEPDGWIFPLNYLVPTYFSCDDELLSINGGHIVEYNKIQELPFEAIDKVHQRGKIDRRDYLFQYLGIKVGMIQSARSRVYLLVGNEKKPSEHFLGKDDTVIVLQTSDDWVKVKYSDRDIGWVKRRDVDSN